LESRIAAGQPHPLRAGSSPVKAPSEVPEEPRMTADTASNWARTLAVSDDLAARREAARQLSLHPEEAQVAAIALVTAASDADE